MFEIVGDVHGLVGGAKADVASSGMLIEPDPLEHGQSLIFIYKDVKESTVYQIWFPLIEAFTFDDHLLGEGMEKLDCCGAEVAC